MTYVKCQIATMGLIPKIHVRGPVANIELDVDTINELVDRGVIILFADGTPITKLVEKDGRVTNVTDVKVATVEDADVKGQINAHGKSSCFKETIVKKEETGEKETEDPAQEKTHSDEKPAATVTASEEEDPHKDTADPDESDPDEDESDEPEPETTPSGNPNPYAGMSRNQAKKARRAAAKKAAEDAARALGQPVPTTDTESQN